MVERKVALLADGMVDRRVDEMVALLADLRVVYLADQTVDSMVVLMADLWVVLKAVQWADAWAALMADSRVDSLVVLMVAG